MLRIHSNACAGAHLSLAPEVGVRRALHVSAQRARGHIDCAKPGMKAKQNLREKMLDCLAQTLAPHLAVFGLRALDLQFVEIPHAQLIKARFANGARRLIDDDGLVYTDLKVRALK